MLGRYVIRRASRNRPIAASMKISTMLPGRSGWEKPSVKSDEPERSNAACQPACSIPQKIRVKPASTRVSHAASVAISPSGAYAPRIRSLRSKLIDGLVTNRNTQRSNRKTDRVILDAVARGRTTVLTAEPMVTTTIAAPATIARIRSAITTPMVGRTLFGRRRHPLTRGRVDLPGVLAARDEAVRHDRSGQQDQTCDQQRQVE